jgi:cellulose synthase/poly-beta-1,6-N-acetylglucosamine synthase-like glycosyltransferase
VLTIIVPSNNEETCIQKCLNALVEQRDLPTDHGMQVIVAANGCQDRTVPLAQEIAPRLRAAGYDVLVLDMPVGHKISALNEAETQATHACRAFVDADVVLGSHLLNQLTQLLAQESAVYASGTVHIPRPKNLASRAYAKVWTKLSFVREGVPGIGLYAINAAGRARWGAFPDIIADDRFVRLQFAPHERQKTQATYAWPLPEGYKNLVHVRHRWSKGNIELESRFPDLIDNDSEINKSLSSILRLLLTPFSSVVFVLVYLASNRRAHQSEDGDTFVWQRGRK